MYKDKDEFMSETLREAIINRIEEEMHRYEDNNLEDNDYNSGIWDGLLISRSIIENEF